MIAADYFVIYYIKQKTVIRTKSVEYMQPWISVAGLCNGIIWASYALILFPAVDPYILVISFLLLLWITSFFFLFSVSS